MDNCRDTDNSVVAGIGEQLHDGRVHPYFAGRRSHCARGRPLSEAINFFGRRLVYILTLQSYDCRPRKGGEK